MRAAVVAVMLGLMSGCSPDEPDAIAVVPEPLAPEPSGVVTNIRGRTVQVQAEEECRQLVELEARLQEMLERYTEQHPQVRAARSDIARLRSGLPADGTFCSEQIEQRLRAGEQPRRD